MQKRTAFFLSFFPRKTETFILNEMIALKEKGLDFQVISLMRVSQQWVKHPILKDILANQYYDMGYGIWLKGLWQALHEPTLLFQQLRWISGLKHKNILFCLRVMSALIIAFGMRGYIRKNNINYLHSHFASYPTEIVMCISRLLNIPYGGTWHAFDIWRDANILAEKITHAEQIMTCTQYNFAHLHSLPGLDKASTLKIKRVYHGVAFDRLPAMKNIEHDYPILAVGRLIPKKGFTYLIDALGILKAQGISIKLNIVGFPRPWFDLITSGEGSELKRIKNKIKQYGLENDVTLLGYVPHQAVFELMNASYAIVMPSVRDKNNNIDGIPNVILEAMAMGRPAIASQLSGIPEVVINGETGLLVPPGNVQSLADAIFRLKQNIALTQKLGMQAKNYVLSHFDLYQNVHECQECFRDHKDHHYAQENTAV